MQPVAAELQRVAPLHQRVAVGDLPKVVALRLRQRWRVRHQRVIGGIEVGQPEAERVGGRIGQTQFLRHVFVEGRSRHIEEPQAGKGEPRFVDPLRAAHRICQRSLLRAHRFREGQQRERSRHHIAFAVEGVMAGEQSMPAELMIDAAGGSVVVIGVGSRVLIVAGGAVGIGQRLEAIEKIRRNRIDAVLRNAIPSEGAARRGQRIVDQVLAGEIAAASGCVGNDDGARPPGLLAEAFVDAVEVGVLQQRDRPAQRRAELVLPEDGARL